MKIVVIISRKKTRGYILTRNKDPSEKNKRLKSLIFFNHGSNLCKKDFSSFQLKKIKTKNYTRRVKEFPNGRNRLVIVRRIRC